MRIFLLGIILSTLLFACYDLSNPNDPNSPNYRGGDATTITSTITSSTTTTIALTPQTTIPAGTGTYLIEAEDAHFAAPLQAENAYGGANGGFYVEGFYNSSNASIKWVVDVAEAGSYNISVRYASSRPVLAVPSDPPENIYFYLNGTLIEIDPWEQINPTDWSQWGNLDFSLDLLEGLNYLEFRSGPVPEQAAANLDYLEISKP